MPPKTVGSSKVETEPRPKIDFLKTSLPKIKSPRTLVLIHNLQGRVMATTNRTQNQNDLVRKATDMVSNTLIMALFSAT